MQLPAQLLRNNPDVHKGDFGHVFILAGSPRFSGAAILSAEAALRSGAGLVTLGIPEGLTLAFIAKKSSEIMLFPLPETKDGYLSAEAYKVLIDFLKEVDVLAMGCGMGRDVSTQLLVIKLASLVSSPVVLDADALFAFRRNLALLKKIRKKINNAGVINTVITPHPGEMSRLLGVTVEDVQSRRVELARQSSLLSAAVVVLKGYRTVVSDGNRVYLNRTGNPGMATAGCGDVLTGIIAALLAQGLDSFEAAKFGVYLHGMAGDIAAKEKTQISLIASDIIDKIPVVIKRLSLRWRSSVGRAPHL